MTILHVLQRVLALISLAVLGTAGYLIWSWWDQSPWLRALDVREDPQATRLYIGAALLAWALLGRFVVLALLARPGEAERRTERGETRSVRTPDGAEVNVEIYGLAHAPALVLTHGWGMDATIWADAKRHLADRYRLIVWDLPGLGRSSQPGDGHHTIERYARDLRTVLTLAEGPAVLVGHSIGGMTVQTFCRLYPELLGKEVAGIVLENTTHTNPLKTTALGGALNALRWPVIEPLMRLDMVLFPLIWAMNWMSYLNGHTHLAFRIAGFGASPTRAQLDHAARLPTKNSPAVQAKGNLAMSRWAVTEALPSIRVPALLFIGGRDLVTRPRAGETIAELLPDVQVVRVQRAGHMGPVEEAAVYNNEIARFADRVLLKEAHSDTRPEESGSAVVGTADDSEGRTFEREPPSYRS